jgi:hypothetical protein
VSRGFALAWIANSWFLRMKVPTPNTAPNAQYDGGRSPFPVKEKNGTPSTVQPDTKRVQFGDVSRNSRPPVVGPIASDPRRYCMNGLSFPATGGNDRRERPAVPVRSALKREHDGRTTATQRYIDLTSPKAGKEYSPLGADVSTKAPVAPQGTGYPGNVSRADWLRKQLQLKQQQLKQEASLANAELPSNVQPQRSWQTKVKDLFNPMGIFHGIQYRWNHRRANLRTQTVNQESDSPRSSTHS